MEIYSHPPSVPSFEALTELNSSPETTPEPSSGKMEDGIKIVDVSPSPHSIRKGALTPEATTLGDHTITLVEVDPALMAATAKPGDIARVITTKIPFSSKPKNATSVVEPFAFPILKKTAVAQLTNISINDTEETCSSITDDNDWQSDTTIDDVEETCSSVADDDDWQSISSDDLGDTWAEVTTADASAASLEEKNFLNLAQRFSEEPETANGSSLYATVSIRDGAKIPLVRAFESYRNKTIQAYREGKTQTAIAWAKVADATQGSIECSIQSTRHSSTLDNTYNPTEQALGICYNAAAQALANYAQHQAEFLTTQALPNQNLAQRHLGPHAENQWLQASTKYNQAIDAFKAGDRKEGEQLQSIADSHQRAAHYLSEQIQYTGKMSSAEQPKERMRYQKMAAQSEAKAAQMIEAAQKPLQARLAKEKQELLKTVSRFIAEPETINGRSSYANNALERGASVPLVRAFESYRNKAVQAYHEGKSDVATQWAKIAEDAQESIEYHIKAFQNVHDANVFHCYLGSAQAMHEHAQNQAEFLTTYKIIPQSDELLTLGVQAEHLFCEAVDTYARAIKVIQQGDRKMGEALQEIAYRQRKAASYLEKYITGTIKERTTKADPSATAQQKAQKTVEEINTQVYWNLSADMLQGLSKAVYEAAEES